MGPEVWISLVSAVVAFAAVAVMVWSACIERAHNRLSVTPRLSFSICYELPGLRAGVYLENKGIGPALIESVEVWVDGTKRPIDSPVDWSRICQSVGLKVDWLIFSMFDLCDAIQVGERFPLITSDRDILRDDQLGHLAAAIKRLDIRVEYRSMYRKGPKLEARLQRASADSQIKAAEC